MTNKKHIVIPGPARQAAGAQKPLTADERRDLLIQHAQQKLGSIAEGVIFNVCRETVKDRSITAEGVVNYAFAVAEAYVQKLYGVTFKPKPAEEEKEAPKE